jgi:hypothetical protein
MIREAGIVPNGDAITLSSLVVYSNMFTQPLLCQLINISDQKGKGFFRRNVSEV